MLLYPYKIFSSTILLPSRCCLFPSSSRHIVLSDISYVILILIDISYVILLFALFLHLRLWYSLILFLSLVIFVGLSLHAVSVSQLESDGDYAFPICELPHTLLIARSILSALAQPNAGWKRFLYDDVFIWLVYCVQCFVCCLYVRLDRKSVV